MPAWSWLSSERTPLGEWDRERGEWKKKKPHKHGNEMSLGCLDRVLGCVELYGWFFNICECLSLWNGACGPEVHLVPKGRTFGAKPTPVKQDNMQRNSQFNALYVCKSVHSFANNQTELKHIFLSLVFSLSQPLYHVTLIFIVTLKLA